MTLLSKSVGNILRCAALIEATTIGDAADPALGPMWQQANRLRRKPRLTGGPLREARPPLMSAASCRFSAFRGKAPTTRGAALAEVLAQVLSIALGAESRGVGE
jgi:hypothetical protein